MNKYIEPIPDIDWEQMLKAVARFPNKIAVVKALRDAGGTIDEDKVPVKKLGASPDSINYTFREAGLSYRINGHLSRVGRLSVQKRLYKKAPTLIQDYSI